MPFSADALLILLMSAFFAKNYHFLQKSPNHWLWSYDNLLLYEIDQKYGNRKYPRLNFV